MKAPGHADIVTDYPEAAASDEPVRRPDSNDDPPEHPSMFPRLDELDCSAGSNRMPFRLANGPRTSIENGSPNADHRSCFAIGPLSSTTAHLQ